MDVELHICTTCGTQHAESDEPPGSCAICGDARQYVNPAGQGWTTMAKLRRSHRNSVGTEDEGLIGIGMAPDFAIGQRALLVRSPGGNVLWDCVALLDDGLAEMIRALGGIRAIAISHPHYYTTMVEWSRAFDAPIYLHAADREWVMRPDPAIEHWEGDAREIGDGMTLLRLGGHFAGGTVLHWAGGAEGRGAILSGDVLQVSPDRRHVSFMYSFPNHLPLPAATVRRIAAAVEPFAFERVFGAWWGLAVRADAKDAVRRSAGRYVDLVEGNGPVT
jgi:hypothetical protein